LSLELPFALRDDALFSTPFLLSNFARLKFQEYGQTEHQDTSKDKERVDYPAKKHEIYVKPEEELGEEIWYVFAVCRRRVGNAAAQPADHPKCNRESQKNK